MYVNIDISATQTQFFHGTSFPPVSLLWFTVPLFKPRASLAKVSWGLEEEHFLEPRAHSAFHPIVSFRKDPFACWVCPFPLMQDGLQ